MAAHPHGHSIPARHRLLWRQDPRQGAGLRSPLHRGAVASVYYGIFLAIGESSWWLGAIFGLAHGLFAGTALVNILLPMFHPRMGTSITSAPSVALLEPPGFMMLNYGRRTPLVSIPAHVAYGTIVGAFVTLAG